MILKILYISINKFQYKLKIDYIIYCFEAVLKYIFIISQIGTKEYERCAEVIESVKIVHG